MAHSDSSPPSLSAESLLAEHELGQAEDLVREAGWNQTIDDWRIFREFGKVLALRASDGRVIATAAIFPYGNRFAWISMVLVTREFQRRGLATRLLRRCIDDIVAAELFPVLDATPAGREVYRTLGFEDSWSFQRYSAVEIHRPAPLAPRGITVRAITDVVWPRLCAYDANIFGADRSGLLARLRQRLPQAALYAERNGAIAGFILGRDGRIATQLGPLVAEGDDVAQALLARAFDSITGTVFIDVADTKPGTTGWLAGLGFTSQRPLTRMLYRRTVAFDDGQRTYAVVGPEFG